MTDTFSARVAAHQVEWRKLHVRTKEMGSFNGVARPWILPVSAWEEGLWPGIRGGSSCSLPDYIARTGVQKHVVVNNLKSSWVLCANLYFPFRQDMEMLSGFLSAHVGFDITRLERLELEYAEDPPLDPTTLLGERQGKRGANQTSPDIAFVVSLDGGGRGLILTESKFTEHSFYECSGRKRISGNPDPARCLQPTRLFDDPAAYCHLLNWADGARSNRKYWSYIEIGNNGRTQLRRCPAAVSGYQLFRQQALAEGIARSGKYGLVASCVAYDARNAALISSLKGAGIDNFAEEWGALFEGKARFAAFTHQDWVRWVRDHDTNGRWGDWLAWIRNRYELG